MLKVKYLRILSQLSFQWDVVRSSDSELAGHMKTAKTANESSVFQDNSMRLLLWHNIMQLTMKLLIASETSWNVA
jgi:hypothetical protein